MEFLSNLWSFLGLFSDGLPLLIGLCAVHFILTVFRRPNRNRRGQTGVDAGDLGAPGGDGDGGF